MNELATTIHTLLLGYYGYPTWRDPLPPVDELVCTILSQNTNDDNRDRAFKALKDRFDDWNEVCLAKTTDVIDAIKPAGLANQKGPRIQQVLNAIIAERGSLDLSFLKEQPVEESRKWLLKFKGVGPKTAAIVLLFSLGVPAFPVDTHIYRVTGRVGLRPDGMNVEEAHHYLEDLFPPESYYAAHLNIIRLGREICTARKVHCTICPLRDVCLYYENHKSQTEPEKNIDDKITL
ncbi:MAG TPA: endonuclease III [Anaerolineales bacterium]|nr:endonuclease III [Anaerolineales bacterium]